MVVFSNGDVRCYSTQSGRLVNSFSVAPGDLEDTGVHVVVAEAYQVPGLSPGSCPVPLPLTVRSSSCRGCRECVCSDGTGALFILYLQATLTVGEAARDRQDVVCACLDKKGRRLLTAFADGTIVWWSLGNGELLRQYRGPRNVTCLRYHSSGVSHPVIAGSWTGVALVLSESGRGVGRSGLSSSSSPSPHAHTTGQGAVPSRPITGRRAMSRGRVSRLSGGGSSPGPRRAIGPALGGGGGGGGSDDGSGGTSGNQSYDGMDTCLLRAPGVAADVLCVACGLSPVRESYIPAPWVVTGHADGRIVLWSAASWKPLSQHVAVDPVTVSGLHASKRSSRAVGSGAEAMGGSSEATARGSSVEQLCWLPHSGVVVAGCGSGYLHVLSLQHDALVRPTPTQHTTGSVGLGPALGLGLGSSPSSGKRASDSTGVLPEALTGEVASVGGIAAPPAVTSMCDGTRGILVVGLQCKVSRAHKYSHQQAACHPSPSPRYCLACPHV